jgi:hypothetical protein
MTDNKVIDIYEWRRPVKPGEFMGCALTELPTPPETERPRKMRPSEVALMIVLVALVSLLVASYV